MKMQSAVLFLALSVALLSVCGVNSERQKRSPDKYDDHYEKFIARHFSDTGSKHVDGKAEYKSAPAESESYEDDEESKEDPKGEVENHGSYGYGNSADYERIKALSEAEVAKLQDKPGLCKHYEKDGMICSECKDPQTGDTSESCAYSSQPNDKKVAYLSKKSHNYKSPVEAEEPVDDEKESEDQEEAPVTPSAKAAHPAKQYKSEMEDAGDYGAYKLANYNQDVDDYEEEPKFAHLKEAPQPQKPQKAEQVKTDFEILPQSQFQSKNLNQALTDFHQKDWSKCNKVMKGDMTCYYCKDAKGATQEECMFISSSNPKNLKVERHESMTYDHNSRKPGAVAAHTDDNVEIIKPAALKVAPALPQNREKFARLRMGRPLMPTKAAKAEPLVTPKTNSNIDPVDYVHSDPTYKKTIKRTVSYKKRNYREQPLKFNDYGFESHVHHE